MKDWTKSKAFDKLIKICYNIYRKNEEAMRNSHDLYV